MSPHTIHSYRDALVLYLRYVASRSARPVDKLDLGDFTAEHVAEFVTFLEHTRGNGIGTRNARLAALHTFARFVATEHPERLSELQRVLGVPFKRGARRESLEYLDQREVEALLKVSAPTTPSSQRDLALFALMFNTGARVQEVLDLQV